ncbi:MAG: cupin domain-containing protein, partial [bacterium]
REAIGVSKREYPQSETSYILEGSGEIQFSDDESVSFIAGDLVTVMPETSCIWNITEAIERHYSKG